MKSDAKLTTALCLAALLAAAGCSTQPANDAPAPSPSPAAAAEQDPREAVEKVLAAVKTDPARGTARDRCLAKQRARLEGCGAKSGQERAVCEAVAKELISVCEQMDPKAPAFLAGLLFDCKGICASKACPAPGCKAPDGSTCLGRVCAAEGAVCHPGVLWDCNCETTVIGPPLMNTPFCSCSCS